MLGKKKEDVKQLKEELEKIKLELKNQKSVNQQLDETIIKQNIDIKSQNKDFNRVVDELKILVDNAKPYFVKVNDSILDLNKITNAHVNNDFLYVQFGNDCRMLCGESATKLKLILQGKCRVDLDSISITEFTDEIPKPVDKVEVEVK